MSPEEIEEAWKKEEAAFFINQQKPLLKKVLRPGGLEMTFSTERAYKAKKTRRVIDLTKRNYYDPNDFFEEIEGNNIILLEPNYL